MFFIDKKEYQNKKEGFTLIETLVSIAILMLAIVSPLTLAQQGLVTARFAKNQIVGFYLAQDTIEYIRSVRDSNIINNNNWLLGLDNCLGSNTCYIDVVAGGNIELCGAECPFLRKDSLTGIYGYDGSDELTSFKRETNIQINPINSDEVFVETVVSWDNGSKNFSVKENLFNLR